MSAGFAIINYSMALGRWCKVMVVVMKKWC